MQEDNTEEHYIRPRRNAFVRLLAWFLSNPIKPAILGVIILLTGSVVCEVSFVRNDFKYTTVSTLGEAYTVLLAMATEPNPRSSIIGRGAQDVV